MSVAIAGKHRAGNVDVDEDGWQKIPLEVEMEMLQQASSGADGQALALIVDQSSHCCLTLLYLQAVFESLFHTGLHSVQET